MEDGSGVQKRENFKKLSFQSAFPVLELCSWLNRLNFEFCGCFIMAERTSVKCSLELNENFALIAV